MNHNNQIYPDVQIGNAILKHGDCLDLMPRLPDHSIHLICSDLPYGTTQCAWDSIIPLDRLWAEYRRLLAPGGCIVLTAAIPFTAVLASSNIAWLKHDVIWFKNRPTGHLNANRAPLRAHESILVFAPPGGAHTYNPQKTSGHKPTHNFYTRSSGDCFGKADSKCSGGGSTERFPTSIQKFDCVPNSGSERIHPTQKPLNMMEWIILTYSNVGDCVLDNCFGSGVTALASMRLGRQFIGIEMNAVYFGKAFDRLHKSVMSVAA